MLGWLSCMHPERVEMVAKPGDYKYSDAANYAHWNGLLMVEILPT